jgi:hypothetical protein
LNFFNNFNKNLLWIINAWSFLKIFINLYEKILIF